MRHHCAGSLPGAGRNRVHPSRPLRFRPEIHVGAVYDTLLQINAIGDLCRNFYQAFAERHEGAVTVFARGPDPLIRASLSFLIARQRPLFREPNTGECSAPGGAQRAQPQPARLMGSARDSIPAPNTIAALF